ncbi:hypothetical protein [Microbacterium sp. RU33B]|uniref:hypothetical protein n=1 Tax=Microbacterium sp. RU33B TaxID=1907390 RepID=UPI00095CF2E1|nr:hypothetical protein [Microbacterium sp. RU33B]SIT72517.1 hypothetical protein SAMN05880545_1066 [Microbacterium sp. RU33B]
MSTQLNQPAGLTHSTPARSWIRSELLTAAASVAVTHNVRGEHSLAEEASYALGFTARLASDLTGVPAIVHYSLPATSTHFDLDRPHSLAEVIGELAFTAADDHDHEQGELIRLVGLEDAVRLRDIAMRDLE